MSEPSAAELVDSILKRAERKDVNINLEPWQRQLLEDVYRYQRLAARIHRQARKTQTMRYVTAKNYTGLTPTLTFLDEAPEYILVRPGQPVKEPVDYYKSHRWLTNREQLKKTLKTWSGT